MESLNPIIINPSKKKRFNETQRFELLRIKNQIKIIRDFGHFKTLVKEKATAYDSLNFIVDQLSRQGELPRRAWDLLRKISWCI